MSEEKKENLEDLQNKIEELEKQKNEYLAGWQRAKADFINHKKEEIERIENFLKYAEEEFILKILPILDNFEIAESNLPEDSKNDENVKGLLQIKSQFLDFLKGFGVEEIKALGEKFDPNFHEAVEQVEGRESGIIIKEMQKGYKINGRLLRPAKVKVIK